MTNTGSRQSKAVLVLPDVGLPEDQMNSMKQEFGNALVDSLERAGVARDTVVIQIEFAI